MGVHAQAQGAVEALHKGDGARMRLCYGRQAQGAFGTAPIAPHELVGDGLHDLGAQRAVVAHLRLTQLGQNPRRLQLSPTRRSKPQCRQRATTQPCS